MYMNMCARFEQTYVFSPGPRPAYHFCDETVVANNIEYVCVYIYIHTYTYTLYI